MNLLDRFRWVGVSSLWVYRVLTWTVLALGLTFAGIVLGLRYWVLPNIESYREDIARIISERARQKITIGRIHANWDGLRPQLRLENVTVYDRGGRPALELAHVDNTLSWLSLLALELRFHAADIHRPTLNVRRDARGIVSIAGIELTGDKDGGGFADWLLRQRDIEVHDASIVWNDEQRGAPQLELKHVSLQLYNQGRRHRFGLRATPPRELAAPLTVRGDFTGESIKALADWNGKIFIQLDYADIAAWRTWIPYPIQFPRGAGALRAWLTFNNDQLVEAVADVRLANVLARLGDDLPELDLAQLSGRLGWKQSDVDIEISTSRLGLVTTHGLALDPADILLRVTRSDVRRPARGEIHANALELATLVGLADYLPLDQEARKRLAEYSPKGGIYDVVARWTGEWREPQQYSVRGRFRSLSLNRSGKIPGFTGVSGTLDANERGGTLALNSNKATVDMPLVFRDVHEFEALTAQATWIRSAGETELKLNSVSFSNSHLAGTVFGNYRTAGSTRGSIDLTGSLMRLDARFVNRYVPLGVGPKSRDWLDRAFIAGQASDVSLRLKGDLDEFPFPDGRGGVFQVTAKVTGGTLRYAAGWPNLESLAGDLIFRGKRMDVRARQGSVFSTRLFKVHVEIADFLNGNEVLNVDGEAEGPTGDFLTFIEKSPINTMIDQFTQGWHAQGSGKLALKLSIPLGQNAAGKLSVAGTYQFAGNTVVISPDLPFVEQAGGRIEFTESLVRAQNVTGTLLGGPVTIAATSAGDSTVRVNVQGRINADSARRTAGDPFWAQRLRGTTDWHALITARKRTADVVVESTLQGLAADLPAPLAKAAADTLPFRFERRVLAGGQDRVRVSFGDVVQLNLLRTVEANRTTITRGAVRFGEPAAEPEDRPGVWVSGTVKALDVDRWRAFLRKGGGETAVEWGGIDLKLGSMDALGRRFNDLTVNATAQSGQWRGTLAGKGIEGTVDWQPQGRGRLVARMKTFTVPAAAPGAAASAAGALPEQKESELPALDLTADQFINKNKMLGRLELSALPEGRDWRIERLRITNPESVLTLDGLWQVGIARPRTQINLRLEASDIGKLLVRLGYPEGVRRGTAKLESALSWTGAPYELDFPTLSGNLVVQANKGQFVKLEPGIGKLLGILSLQALPRRITLDFRDVFSEGFAFDEIVGALKVDRGVASMDKFRIQGPAATVFMSGEVDLAKETQKLRVRISPHVSDTVSLAGALVGGPIAGVAAFLAQKVLKDPINQIVSYEYDVTGTWAEPNVKRFEQSMTEAGKAQQ